MEFKGYILTNISDYEAKQQEMSSLTNMDRYCGRIIDGVIIPDIILSDGRLFIRDESNGTDIILKSDILQL